MVYRTQRAFQRNKTDTPARYESVEAGKYYDSRIVNYSNDGLCLEGQQQLPYEALVNIDVLKHTPGAFGPEGYRAFLGEVRWCREVRANGSKIYDMGVQVISKKREADGMLEKPGSYSCQLCGDSVLARHVTEILEWVYLCPYCCRHFHALPQGRLKDSIERFMIGNVI